MNNNSNKKLIQELLGYKSKDVSESFLRDVKDVRQFSDVDRSQHPHFSNTGVKLQLDHNPETIIDGLAFSFPLSSLSDKYLRNNPDGIKFPSSDMPFNPKKFSEIYGQERPETDTFTINQGKEVLFSDTARLSKLVRVAFGLTVGAARGFGKNHYKQTHNLECADGSVGGFLCYGGNKDTGYIYITGKGMQFVRELRTPPQLYYWVDEYFRAPKLSRVDIAYDDFDGIFTTDDCLTAWDDDAFNGKGRKPKCSEIIERGSPGHTVYVGSRQSMVFWRSYDKQAEQGLDPEDGIWFRHEAEIKKAPTEILCDLDGSFASCNKFAMDMVLRVPVAFSRAVKRAERTMDSVTKWLKTVVAPTWLEHAKCLSGSDDLDDSAILNSFKILTKGKKAKALGLPPSFYEPVPF